MSPEFISVVCSYIVGIVVISVCVAILGLADYTYRDSFLNELDEGFIGEDEDGNRWGVGYKKE